MSTVDSYFAARQSADVAADKTLAEADSGVVQNVTADGKVLTLPSTVVGMKFVIRNGGSSNGVVGVTVSPAAADKIMGNGYTSADNKDAVNTKATALVGDELTLIGDGANGWFIEKVVGIWAKEA